jgi:hypothetical protein
MTTEKCNYLKIHNTTITVKPCLSKMTQESFMPHQKIIHSCLWLNRKWVLKSGFFQSSGNKRERDIKKGGEI